MARISESQMRRMAEETKTREANCFYNHLKKPGLSIIGEFKKASPSLGTITSKIDLMERIAEYNASVDAISCLTEEDHFHGNVAYLKEIRAKSSLPILRKDFMICEYQFYEAKVIGADAVLLITAILDDAQMHDFYQLARELELDVLVETHDEAEVERAMKINPRIIGVNNRNLKDFTISLEHTRRLRPYVPEDKVFVAESGITGDEDVRFLRDCGVDAFFDRACVYGIGKSESTCTKTEGAVSGMRPEVKICGLKKPADAQYVNDAGADYAGFVFYEKKQAEFKPATGRRNHEKISPRIKKVAVTVSPNAAQIKTLQQMKFDIIQMHGKLSEDAITAAELPVWYAINLSDPEEFEAKTKSFFELPEELQQKITAIVVDGAGYGGGQRFDWQKQLNIDRQAGIFAGRKFVLAGGLHAGNVAEGIRLFDPDIVDVSSGVEEKKIKKKKH